MIAYWTCENDVPLVITLHIKLSTAFVDLLNYDLTQMHVG